MKLYIHYLFGINAKSDGITDNRHKLGLSQTNWHIWSLYLCLNPYFLKGSWQHSIVLSCHITSDLQHKGSLVFSYLLLHFVLTFTVRATTLSYNYLFEYLSSPLQSVNSSRKVGSFVSPVLDT